MPPDEKPVACHASATMIARRAQEHYEGNFLGEQLPLPVMKAAMNEAAMCKARDAAE